MIARDMSRNASHQPGRVRSPSRRGLLGIVGTVALMLATPLRAQRVPHVAWVSPTRANRGSAFLESFRLGMQQAGHVEGKTYRLDVRWGDDSSTQLQRIVGDVVAANPDVIVAFGVATPLFKAATSTIPVVFGYSGDPVEAGFVDSLARPGRNLTGISFLTLELAGKRIEIAREIIPNLRQVAILAAPQHPGDQAERRASEAGAKRVGVRVVYFEATNPAELEVALTAIERSQSDAAVFFPVQYVMTYRERIAEWGLAQRIPTISGWGQFADAGNLLTYGPSLDDSSARLGNYTARILRGGRPADMPVELPTRVEFVINQRTAHALGLRVPNALLVRADRVIE